MPIYSQTYRTYEGSARRRFRWWVMTVQELRVLSRTRAFIALVVLGYLHVFFRLLQIVAYDSIVSDPTNPLGAQLRNVAAIVVDSTTFFDFLRIQAPIVFLMSILAGAGMICGDFQNNLMEIYFSKPLTWRDYVMGKLGAVVLAGLCFTAVPGIFLIILHNLLDPGWDTLGETYWMPLSTILFSLTIVLPCSLGVLASSALSRGERYASIAVFMALFADLAIGRLLPELLHERNYAVIAFPLAINRVGEVLFRQRQVVFDLPWGWSALFIATVCLAAFGIVCRRVRRAEIAL